MPGATAAPGAPHLQPLGSGGDAPMKRYFTADLHFTDPAVRKRCGRPANADELIADNINAALKPGDLLYIVGGLYSESDKPTGYASRAGYGDDNRNELQARIQSLCRIDLDIRRALVMAGHDDESFVKRFNRYLCFRPIMPFLTMQVAGRSVMLAHDPGYAAVSPELPLLCSTLHAPGMPSPPSARLIDVGIDRNGLKPFSEEQLEVMLL